MAVSVASNLPPPSLAKASCRAGIHLSVDGSRLAVSEIMIIAARSFVVLLMVTSAYRNVYVNAEQMSAEVDDVGRRSKLWSEVS